MSRDLSNPLQSLIARAAAAPPGADAAGEAGRHRARYESAGSSVVVLADCSGSMEERAGSQAKVDLLRQALADCWPDLPGAILCGFASTCREAAGPADLPTPAGGTALHLALDFAAGRRPRLTLVVSDGRPDDEAAALAAAAKVPGRIDVVYCGPDSDAQAIAFMRALAREGAGRVVVCDVVRKASGAWPALSREVRSMLGLPAPKGGA